MGYHTREITKGILGDFSKIKEEFEELEDAHLQQNKILELCELSDLLGAIENYVQKKYNLTLGDINLMNMKTQEAFKEGKR